MSGVRPEDEVVVLGRRGVWRVVRLGPGPQDVTVWGPLGSQHASFRTFFVEKVSAAPKKRTRS